MILVQSEAFSQSSEKSILRIKYVNPGINTIIAVDYKIFDSAFHKNLYRDTAITDSVLTLILLSQYKMIRYCKAYKKIDTRYKISFFPPELNDPILIYMSYNGEAVINNRLLSKCNFLKTLKGITDSLVNKR